MLNAAAVLFNQRGVKGCDAVGHRHQRGPGHQQRHLLLPQEGRPRHRLLLRTIDAFNELAAAAALQRPAPKRASQLFMRCWRDCWPTSSWAATCRSSPSTTSAHCPVRMPSRCSPPTPTCFAMCAICFERPTRRIWRGTTSMRAATSCCRQRTTCGSGSAATRSKSIRGVAAAAGQHRGARFTRRRFGLAAGRQ